MNAAISIDTDALDDDAVNDIVCRQQVAREMRLSAQGADLVTGATLARAADALTGNDDTTARAEASALPASTLRTLLLALCDTLVACDWGTITDALDAWERSGEMEPALWMLQGETGAAGEICNDVEVLPW